MTDFAILVTTFERPFKCLKCVRSIRKYYPHTHIVVADNGRRRWWLKFLLQKLANVDYLLLPFDSGLSKSRNEALKRIWQYYVVVCDDDFIFTEETQLWYFYRLLEESPEIGLVAGNLRYGDKIEPFSNEIKINKGFHWVVPIKNPKWFNFLGRYYAFSDYVYNFFMMRHIPDFRWDEDYKIGREHIDFFLNLKLQNKWKVAYMPSVIANHHNGLTRGRYRRFRKRTDSFRLFYKKTGKKLNFSPEISATVYDEKSDEMIPYPEYVWKRMVEDKQS